MLAAWAAVDEPDELHQRVTGRIREIAAERKIPVTHLPDRAAVSRAHFWDVLAGKKSPTLQWLGRIAEALGVDAAEFFVRKQ
ncbi:helix-turn-helix transcriptional regulator [Sorangium sp. So ce321]|uniref:helix-turn-helix domain-containing protein n=1 Tax=Sorangium sp. So ce321 TaxID=3133300 RepID=UPI003F6232E9